MNSIRPTFSRARAAQLMLVLCIVFSLVSIYSTILQIDLLKSVSGGEVVSEEMASSNDTREGVVALLYFSAIIGTIVSFILWFRRSYYNLHQKTSYLRFSEGMAAGAWFIPFVNLVRPFQIFRDLFNKTVELYEERDITYPQPLAKAVMGIWWTLWVVSNILSNIASRMTRDDSSVNTLLDSSYLTLAYHGTSILAAILLIQLIRNYESLSTQLELLPDENIFLVEQVPLPNAIAPAANDTNAPTA